MSSRVNSRATTQQSPPIPDVVLSLLHLPPEAVVLCTSFAPLGEPATHAQSIDVARRHIYNSRDPNSLLDSFLAHVDNSQHDSRLAVFAIAASSAQSTRATALASLALHNLIAVDTTSFDFNQLYSNRTDTQSSDPQPAFITPSLHRLYLAFLAALRTRMLADICDTYSDRIRASCVRMRDGFLLVPRQLDSEWAVGWDNPQRRLAHCHLHLQWMNASTVAVRPVFNTSPYSHLSTNMAVPGQPITLLPYAVPAYFLAPYSGSTAALSQHFSDSLTGLGAGPNWEGQGYVLCWIAVQDSQSEDKAVLAVWPAALAVACTDRPPADRLPTVPDHFALTANSPVPERALPTALAKRTIPVVVKQSSDMPRVASSVAGFVDAMAKEREREREKAKEERYRRLNVSVPQSGSGGGPRSTLSGSAGGIPPLGSASDHFPSPGLPLSQFASPANDSPAVPLPLALNAPWVPLLPETSAAPPTSSFSAVDDFYGALSSNDPMADLASFGLMTEDDFSFFDQPAVPVTAAEPPTESGLGGDIVMTIDDLAQQLESHDGMGMPLFGTGWTPEYAPDPPRSVVTQFQHDLLSALPSPAKTPWTLPEPATPGLVFAHDLQSSSDPFDQIPFALAHGAADAKYTAGKFSANTSMPLSPAPSTEDDDDTVPFADRYKRSTNPSVGVVQRLRLAKRKSVDQGRRPSLSPWERGEPEWITYPPSPPEALPSPSSSEADSSDEDGAGLFGDYDECDVPEQSAQGRAATPVPDAVLIGPALLRATFAHRTLVPLSVPFPPPASTSSAPTPAGAQPISVPTPVSPAAAGAGATPFERARNLEPVATAFAREVTENPTWAAAWRMLGEKKERPVWREEIDQSVVLLSALPYLNVGPRSAWSVTPLTPPRVTLEKGGSLIQVVPTALRFWEKLGLGPRAGPKHVTAFVLYEDGSDAGSSAASWLDAVSKAFSSRGLGTHTAGTAVSYEGGLVPLRWELFRKTLSNLVASLASPSTPAAHSLYVVFYIVVPPGMMSLCSTFLRNVLGVACSHLKLPGGVLLDHDRMLLHLLPEAALHDSSLFPTTAVASSVYDRLPRVAERHRARAFFKRGLAWRASFDAASFSLARNPGHTKVDLQWEWPLRRLDVVDKLTFLHVAYRISQCGHWVLFAATDERGESHSLATWPYSPETTQMELVQDVWKRAMDLAMRASVEWRIVIARSGAIGREEYDAWSTLWDKIFGEADAPCLQVALISVHSSSPFTLLPQSVSNPLRRDSAVTASDERPTSVSYMSDQCWKGFILRPPHTQPLDILAPDTRATSEWSIRDASFDSICNSGVVPVASTTLLRAATESSQTAMCHLHLFRLVNSPSSETPPAKHLDSIVRNYSDLATLSYVRLCGASTGPPVLALHLAAVEGMDLTFSVADLAAEVVGTHVDQES